MEEPYLHTGIDHFLPRLPARLMTVAAEDSGATSEYFLMVYRGGARRSMAEVEGGKTVYGDGRLVEVRLGSGAVALMAAMYRSLAALSAVGLDVIVDDVIYDRRVLRAAVEALDPRVVLFVGLCLPRDVAERREREREGRGPGGTAAFYDLVHAHGIYDLELDTSVASPGECAQRIKEAIYNGHPRTAFHRLARVFADEQPQA